MKYISTVNNQSFTIDIVDENHLSVNGVHYEVDYESVSGQPLFSLLVNGKSYEAYVYATDIGWEVLLQGRLYPVIVEDEREKRLKAAAGGTPKARGDFHLKAPMPGLVISILVADGQQIEQGDVLILLESMKMQNELTSPRAGKISRIRIEPGDNVALRQTLLSVI